MTILNAYNYRFYGPRVSRSTQLIQERESSQADDGATTKAKKQKGIFVMSKKKWYSKASKKELQLEIRLDGDLKEREMMHRIIQCKIR